MYCETQVHMIVLTMKVYTISDTLSDLAIYISWQVAVCKMQHKSAALNISFKISKAAKNPCRLPKRPAVFFSISENFIGSTIYTLWLSVPAAVLKNCQKHLYIF